MCTAGACPQPLFAALLSHVTDVFLELTFDPARKQGYASEMDNPAMVPLVPAPLQNKKEVLFGNMPEIYHFHRR